MTDIEKATDRNYIQSIVAMRAIAVVAVVLFHIEESILPGGFLGVDLFFVISGFVVTKSIVDSRDFKFSSFYKRRFFRLMPAAAFVILATIITWLTFFDDFVDFEFKVSALSSLVGIANFNFMLLDGYWSDSLKTNPFLHYWSLGVEEQYYLLWPLFVVLAFKKYARSFSVLLVVLFLSLIVTINADKIYDSASFYMMPSRVFQFVTGALAYQLLATKVFRNFEIILFHLGLLGILVCFFIFDGNESSFIWLMVTPTIAAFFLLLGCQNKTIAKFIVNKVSLALGNASYSIYLVHWPIIVFWNIAFGTIGPGSLVILFCSTILAGIFCYKAIERPCQLKLQPHNPNLGNSRLLYGPALFAMTLVVVAVFISLENNHTSKGEFVASKEYLSTAKDDKPSIVTSKKSIWSCNTYEQGRLKGNEEYKLFDDLPLDLCLKGDVLLIGDSWGPEALAALHKHYGAEKVAALTSAGCIPIQPKSDSSPYLDCNKMNEFRFDRSLLLKFETIFIASNFNRWPKKNISIFFQYLSSTHSSVYIFSNRPEFSLNVAEILKAKKGKKIDLKRYLSKGVKERYQYMIDLSQNHENISLIDWYDPFFINGDLIYKTKDGNQVFKDTHHLTSFGTEMIANKLVDNMTWK